MAFPYGPKENAAMKPKRQTVSQPSAGGGGVAWKHGIAAGLLVMTTAVGVYWWILGNDETTAETEIRKETHVGLAEEVKPAAAATNAVPEIAATNKPRKAEENLTPQERARREKIREKIAKYNKEHKPVKQAFKTGTEQLLAILTSTEPGMRPIPLPTTLSPKERENLAAILISKNEIEEGDSEALKQQKETVALAKKEMLKFIKDGGEPKDFFDYYYGELNRLAEKRELAMQEANRLQRTDVDLYEDFVNQVNEKLKAEGIKEIPIRYFGANKHLNKEVKQEETQQ